MKLFLIDGNSFCYRAYYAIKSLSTSKGEPTNAIYGFISMLNKLLKEQNPGFLAVCFDLKGPTFRHHRFKEYKIQRRPMPDDLVSQMPLIKDVLRAYNVPIFEQSGYEADDLIATIARLAENSSIDTCVVTGDKDILQLVGPRLTVYNSHKEGLIYDAAAVKSKFGVEPGEIVEFMALAGDASDNIPGVTGIGPKTAAALIEEYGSVEKVYDNLDKIRPNVAAKLKAGKESAFLSRELVTLKSDIPLRVDFEDLKRRKPDNKKLISLFTRFEFRALLRGLEPSSSPKGECRFIRSKKGFTELLKELGRSTSFAVDFETGPAKDELFSGASEAAGTGVELKGISFCREDSRAYYMELKDGGKASGASIQRTRVIARDEVPKQSRDCGVYPEQSEGPRRNDVFTEHLPSGGLSSDYVLGRLKPLFENEAILKFGQDLKYGAFCLAGYGIELKGVGFDTMVASYLLNPSKSGYDLEEICLAYLGTSFNFSGPGNSSAKETEPESGGRCACARAQAVFRLKPVLEKELKQKGLAKLFFDVEVPLIEVLKSMELAGVALDTPYLKKLSKNAGRILEVKSEEIYELAGEEFNINSPKQLSYILIEKLKFPPLKKTKTGISTDVEVLKSLRLLHPLAQVLLEYRELAKLKSTYIDVLPQLVNPVTGRLHTSFNQTVTATGRLSSSGPNLQNIPVKSEEGKKVRRAFVCGDKDSLLLSADYSQIELRILAHLSEDPDLIKSFRDGIDVHNYTASLIFDRKDVTGEMRAAAKTVNFGIIYGMSPYGLSRELGIGAGEAKRFIDAYFRRYPGVKRYIERQIKEAKDKGWVTTLLGRRRYIPEWKGKGEGAGAAHFAERLSVNTPIQGSAADIIKVAMLRVYEQLKERDLRARMVLQVHDELVFDLPRAELDEVKKMVKENMEGVFKLNVPLKVELKAGKNWLEMEKVD